MTPPEPSPISPHRASSAKFKAELRRAVRRNAREPEISFLNITAMLDIMTIILVFSLKTMSESSAAVPQNDDLRLPKSILSSQPSEEGVLVTVSKTQILVGDNKVLSLPGRESLTQTGVGAQEKRSGPNDLYIVKLGNALQSARKVDRRVREAKGVDASSSEARIVADGTTPYRLLIEVLFTLGQSEFGKYHLMVMQGKEFPR